MKTMDQHTLMEYITPQASMACKEQVRSYLMEDFTRMFEVLVMMQQRAKDELMEQSLISSDNRQMVCYSMMPTSEPHIKEEEPISLGKEVFSNSSVPKPRKSSTATSHRFMLEHRQDDILDKAWDAGWSSEHSFDKALMNQVRQLTGEEQHLLESILDFVNQKARDL